MTADRSAQARGQGLVIGGDLSPKMIEICRQGGAYDELKVRQGCLALRAMGRRASASQGAGLAAELQSSCVPWVVIWIFRLFTWQVEDVHDTLAVPYSPPLDLILSADTFIYVRPLLP